MFSFLLQSQITTSIMKIGEYLLKKSTKENEMALIKGKAVVVMRKCKLLQMGTQPF